MIGGYIVRKANSFVQALLGEYRYAFVTISDGTETICEGTANSLSKILNFHDLDIRSFFVSEAEDGSIQADVQIRTGGAHAVTG